MTKKGYKQSESHKILRIASRKKNYPKWVSDRKTCSENISKGLIGRKSWNKGKHLSEETKRKISEANIGKKHTKEELFKMYEARKRLIESGWISPLKGRRILRNGKKKIKISFRLLPNIVYNYQVNKVISMNRDDLKCKRCNTELNLTTHHIDKKGFLVSIEERNDDVNNLITLCDKCHNILEDNLSKIEYNQEFVNLWYII